MSIESTRDPLTEAYKNLIALRASIANLLVTNAGLSSEWEPLYLKQVRTLPKALTPEYGDAYEKRHPFGEADLIREQADAVTAIVDNIHTAFQGFASDHSDILKDGPDTAASKKMLEETIAAIRLSFKGVGEAQIVERIRHITHRDPAALLSLHRFATASQKSPENFVAFLRKAYGWLMISASIHSVFTGK